jgi:SAM-dependent methyltransferase
VRGAVEPAVIYDRIGTGYSRTRRADPRIAAMISRALGAARTVVNVGAGTGSYEPTDRRVVAVEPSSTMVGQRPAGGAPVVRASAVDLPFCDGAFSAALAVLTVHHWPDRLRGLAELARGARDGAVVLTWDPDDFGFWLVDDYLPEIAEIDRAIAPTLDELRRALGPISVEAVPVPHDCADGFLGAYWRRPQAYLDPSVRGAISTFAMLAGADAALERLRDDVASGAWERRYADLLRRDALDVGYRLVVSGRLARA